MDVDLTSDQGFQVRVLVGSIGTSFGTECRTLRINGCESDFRSGGSRFKFWLGRLVYVLKLTVRPRPRGLMDVNLTSDRGIPGLSPGVVVS